MGLEAGEGGEGRDLDAMKKLDEKGVKRAMRGLGREGWKRVCLPSDFDFGFLPFCFLLVDYWICKVE